MEKDEEGYMAYVRRNTGVRGISPSRELIFLVMRSQPSSAQESECD